MDFAEFVRTMHADYYDMRTGYIYHVQEYRRAKDFGIPVTQIRVSSIDDGQTIGYVPAPKEE